MAKRFKKNAKKIAAKVIVFILAAIFILSTVTSVIYAFI